MMQLNAPAGMAPAGCILARFFKKFLLHWDVTKVLLEPRRLAVKKLEFEKLQPFIMLVLKFVY